MQNQVEEIMLDLVKSEQQYQDNNEIAVIIQNSSLGDTSSQQKRYELRG
jgi:hypothetical protein